MAVDHEEDWQNTEQVNWRGLTLTDPIKTIQVSHLPFDCCIWFLPDCI